MSYPSPPPSPPPYDNLPPGPHMENLFKFDLRRGSRWPLKDFCDALHRTHTNSSQLGVVAIQHRKRVYTTFQHEFAILDVVPLVPGTGTPQAEGSHTYVEVGRMGYNIWGFARDEVLVLRQADEASVEKENSSRDSQYGEHLATLSWETGIPCILDVFSLITLLSLTFPRYNIITYQCFWFARIIYEALRDGYGPFSENTGDKIWKRTRFYIFNRVLTPTPPLAILEFCYRQRIWRELARSST